MKFRNFATNEIIEAKVLVVSRKNETVVEDLKTGDLMIVFKNKHGDYQIKGRPFYMVK